MTKAAICRSEIAGDFFDELQAESALFANPRMPIQFTQIAANATPLRNLTIMHAATRLSNVLRVLRTAA